ncbi:unnamed protein product [Arctogadus glacialis]
MPGWKKNIPACLQPDQEGGGTCLRLGACLVETGGRSGGDRGPVRWRLVARPVDTGGGAAGDRGPGRCDRGPGRRRPG